MITEFLTFIGGAATVGAFKGPVQTLQDYWYITFGHSASEKVEQLRIKHAVNSELLKKQLLTEVSKIEEPNIQEPPLQILGPTLESSKYYIEEEEMRNMFAKLLASSMDKSKNDIIHNSFVETIKQLSPLDAQLIKYLSFEGTVIFPLSRIIKNLPDNEGHREIIPIFFFTEKYDDIDKNVASLSNLERLGLISTSFETFLSNDLKYSPMEKSDRAKAILSNNADMEFKRGIIKITPYAQNFIATCL